MTQLTSRWVNEEASSPRIIAYGTSGLGTHHHSFASHRSKEHPGLACKEVIFSNELRWILISEKLMKCCVLGFSNVYVFMSFEWLPQSYLRRVLTSLSLVHSVGLPTHLEMGRQQVSEWSFNSHITIFRPFEREGTSCSNACLSLTALWVTLPPKDQHQEGKINNAVKFNFPLLFFSIFSPLMHRLKCVEFSDVSI